MKNETAGGERYTESFIKAAQYIVRLTAQQEVPEELGKIIVNYFHAAWVALAGRDADGRVFLRHCTIVDGQGASETILSEKTKETICDVLDSGFLASGTVVLRETYEITFLPLAEQNRTTAVLMIAHGLSAQPSGELLNFYLALAGIAGTTMDRISMEQELRIYQGHLEELVRERTGQLKASNEKLGEEIVERRAAEEALRESQQRWATTLESIGDAVIATDVSGSITFMNAVAEGLTGWTLREAAGNPVEEVFNIVNEYTRETVPNPVVKVLEKGMIVGLANHTLLVRKDGTEVPIDDSGAPIKDGDRITGVVLVFRDITERKAAEDALKKVHDQLEQRVEERTAELRQAYVRLMEQTEERRQLEQDLRQAQKIDALGTLTGGIAHDFNNILAAIIGFTDVARGRLPEGSRDKQHLDRVMEAAIRGRDLIKQMLTFSRKGGQEKRALRLASITRETMKLLRASIPSTVSIRVDVKNESGMILADLVQIQQVLLNLCTNAAHAMRDKGGILHVELSESMLDGSDGGPRGAKPGPYVRLMVRDTGAGISPDIMDKIFDPFFTTKKPGEGTGLGLSVVHGIVKQHDGHLTVASEPGDGATFIVYFPKITESPARRAASEKAAPTGGERVLFVDDEEMLAEMGQELLEELGYDVTVKTSSTEAFALFKAEPSRFDLVITDQTMPDLTGIDFATAILALRPGMPIIMCTGYSHLIDADKAEAAGVRAFALKPLTKQEIAKTIRKVLDG